MVRRPLSPGQTDLLLLHSVRFHSHRTFFSSFQPVCCIKYSSTNQFYTIPLQFRSWNNTEFESKYFYIRLLVHRQADFILPLNYHWDQEKEKCNDSQQTDRPKIENKIDLKTKKKQIPNLVRKKPDTRPSPYFWVQRAANRITQNRCKWYYRQI